MHDLISSQNENCADHCCDKKSCDKSDLERLHRSSISHQNSDQSEQFAAPERKRKRPYFQPYWPTFRVEAFCVCGYANRMKVL